MDIPLTLPGAAPGMIHALCLIVKKIKKSRKSQLYKIIESIEVEI